MPRHRVVCVLAVILLGGLAATPLSAYVVPKKDAKEKDAKKELDPKQLVGVWAVDDGPAGLPKGTTLEFTADGKLMIAIGEIKVEGGTYRVEGAIITITPPQGKEGKGRITALTDDKLVIKDDAEPKELVMKRVKKEE